MEQNNSSTQFQAKKKVKKITTNAVIILCAISLIFGIILGKAFSSNKIPKEVEQQIAKLEQDLNFEITKEDAKIKAQAETIADLNAQLAEANQQIKDLGGQTAEAPEDIAATESEEESEAPAKSSGSAKKVITVILVLVLVGCLGFAVVIFVKKGRRNDDEDYFDDEDYEDDEEYEDEDEYEDDDEYDDDEYEDDDEYDDDDEYEDDEDDEE